MVPVPSLQLAGSASDFLGKATFDSSYQDEREQISDTCQTSSDHLTAGLIGLSSGVFGGLTSIFTQPYYSARDEGIGVRGGGEEGGEEGGKIG